MSEMIERVARAMAESRPVPEGHVRGEVNMDAFREMARAAIEVMREPTEEMRKALYEYSPNEWDEGMYIVMIEAALQSSPKAT
jgi:hypothetical protein